MGYRRCRRPLTLVARRPSLVARHWGISEFHYACFGEFAAYGQRSKKGAELNPIGFRNPIMLTYIIYLLYLLYSPTRAKS